jgi:hypothetical protein
MTSIVLRVLPPPRRRLRRPSATSNATVARWYSGANILVGGGGDDVFVIFDDLHGGGGGARTLTPTPDRNEGEVARGGSIGNRRPPRVQYAENRDHLFFWLFLAWT